MNAGDVVLMRPNLVHPGDVEALKRDVKFSIRFGDFLDALCQHGGPSSQKNAIILYEVLAGRGEF